MTYDIATHGLINYNALSWKFWEVQDLVKEIVISSISLSWLKMNQLKNVIKNKLPRQYLHSFSHEQA